jgi:predicted nuclease with TOPRIM domain
MISLEQVQLLETKVARAIEYVQRVTAENTALVSERAGLQAKLDSTQKRIDELEVLVMRFKEDQGRIEDGIIAALDRLSQFEEAFENSLKENPVTPAPSSKKNRNKSPDPEPEPEASSNSEIFFEIPVHENGKEKQQDDNLSSVTSTERAAASEGSTLEGELDIF